MTFSTLTFLLAFLPLLMVLYFAVPSRFTAARNFVLLMFSLVFYAWGEPLYVFLILGCVLLTYLCSFGVAKKSKAALIAGTLVNLAPLFVYKYGNFILFNLSSLTGLEMPGLNLIMPIGISFYTFQVLTYVIDLYKGEVGLQKNPAYLALYVFFFPQLIAGPIVRYSTVEEEINHRRSTLAGSVEGARRFILGLAKKMIIANQAGYVVSVLQAQNPDSLGPAISWICVICYGVQIFYDFSGYSDMAIGLGKIFGFHFLENFNRPYIARSITDFWRRWHISLSSFFRDYIYIPLGGSRCGKARNLFNLFAVWSLTGMWHGAFWNYIFWGLYFFVLLVIEKFFTRKLLDRLPAFISRTVTLFFVMIGWAIFMTESNSPGELLRMLGRLFGLVPSQASTSLRALSVQGGVLVSLIGLLLTQLPLPRFLREILPQEEKRLALRAAFKENGRDLYARAKLHTKSQAQATALIRRVYRAAKNSLEEAKIDSKWLSEIFTQERTMLILGKPETRYRPWARRIAALIALMALLFMSVMTVVGESFNPFIYFRF